MGWWDNKLGGRPAGPVQSPLLPRGVGVQAPPPVYPGTQPYQQVQPYQQPYQPTAEELGYDPATEIPAGVAMRTWKGDPSGGAKETATLGSCPQCGSPRYFSRSSEAKYSMSVGAMVSPTPECFECGYPRQQGTLGVGAKTQGSAKAARQGAMMPLAIDKPNQRV
jgi:ribosomal protein L37E